MAMGCATDGKRLRQTPANCRLRATTGAGVSTKYRAPDVHVAAFALPRFIADAVAKATRRSFRFVRIDVRMADETIAHHANVFRWAELRISPVAKMLYKPCRLACFWEEKS